MISVYSCKKDNATGQNATESTTPVTHDKPYLFNSNTNREVGIMIEDAMGNLQALDKNTKKNGANATSTCNDDSYAMKLVYRGYTVDGICFNINGGVSSMSVSWDLYLPEDVNIVTDATCNARIKVGPIGFSTTPTGTGFRTLAVYSNYIETVNIDGAGTMMKKWRITSGWTDLSESDYCGNFTIIPTFRIKTDCIDIAIIQPALTTDYMDVNSRSVPDLWAQNGTDGGGKKIEFVPNIPLCGNGCHGYWKWATYLELRYKLTSASTWSTFYQNSSSVISFKVAVAPGTYEYQYRGLIRGSIGSTDAVWSEWIAPYTTPTVTIP